MLRIIAGKYRGRKIETKENAKIRPTGAKARGAMFNILMHGEFRGAEHSPLIDRRVVDVFCGTGALGLEALSRGAAHVTFVDQSAESISLVRANVSHMGETGNAQFIRTDSTSLPRAHLECSLAFLDPPYGSGLAAKSLKSLDKNGWLKPGAIAVVETGAKEKFEAPEAYTLFDERKYGNTRIVFLRYGQTPGL
jgi:16S rRNA (guanine966-N2)-methyltransferase